MMMMLMMITINVRSNAGGKASLVWHRTQTIKKNIRR